MKINSLPPLPQTNEEFSQKKKKKQNQQQTILFSIIQITIHLDAQNIGIYKV